MKPEHQNVFMKIGLNISYFRKEKNMTQQKLADISGISRNHLQRIERGAAPSLDTVIDIAAALQIPVYKLFEFR